MAKEIYKQIGGSGNADKVYNCMTRVRIDIRDDSRVNMDGLKGVDGVMGVVEDGSTLQIVVGPGTAAKVAAEMSQFAGVSKGEEMDVNLDKELSSGRAEAERRASEVKSEQKKKNDTPFKRALRIIASIFVPLIPAFVGAGIIGGISSILQNLMTAGTISSETG